MMKVVLLNDTSKKPHHGCWTVISTINKLVCQKNGKVVYSNRVGKNWQKNKNFLYSLQSADLVIVNGEGTIHHSQQRGLDLVKIAKFAKERYSIKSVLINASFQDNSEEIVEYTRYFYSIYVRDSYSQFALAEHGIDSKIVPDLSFHVGYNLSDKSADVSAVAVTDSVFRKTSEMLCKFSRQNGYRFMPIISYPKIHTSNPVATRIKRYRYYCMRALYATLRRLGFPLRYTSLKTLYYVDEYDDYIQVLSSAGFACIGRYHALCFALKTLTPFVALKSNSHKVEGLLNDVGGLQDRIVDVNDRGEIKVEAKPFSHHEIKLITSFVESAKLKIEDMFDCIMSCTHESNGDSRL